MNITTPKKAYVATTEQVAAIDQLLAAWARAAAGGVVSHEAIRDQIIATCVSFESKPVEGASAAALSSQSA